MSPEAEKTDSSPDQAQPAANLGNNPVPMVQDEHEHPKRRINGGLDAWLSVLAGFCIFVNSWYVILIFSTTSMELIVLVGAF